MVAAGLAACALVVPLAGPAGADPPRPGDYRSTARGISPATDGVEAEVIGGDALIQLTVEPGHEAIVLGYQDEPYLRFRADGTVQENRTSPATYLNATRYGEADVPEGLDEEAAPRWRTVADGGRYSWHDHRIHWMSTQIPADVERGSEVQEWEVPLVVDGAEVTLDGVLVLEPAVAWWPWVLAVAGVAGLVWGLGRRRPVVVAAVAGAVACVLVAVVAGVEQLSFPAEAGRMWLAVVVPGVGLLAAAAAGVLAVRSGRVGRVGTALGLVAAGLAGGTAGLRLAVFTNPVLPTDLAPWLDRAGTAASLGLAIGTAALLVATNRRPGPPAQPERHVEVAA